ncbi:hypothetical protein GCM10023226_41940 [Nocardioides nanhaiensis]|uniref:Helix-turn-helix domain-containing protein n=1 Tax=Nocardioides nanhaiensis TaxID=1476871 RepID=A0ABP8X1P8_9ACTN
MRRRVGLPAVLGAAAAVTGVAYLARASSGGSLLEWAVGAVMVLVAAAYGLALLDSRAPLMVADRHGVRLRRGRAWTGVAWPEVELVEHLPRRGLVRDGWILVARAHDDDLVVPLSLSTRLVDVAPAEVSVALDELADGLTEVVEIDPALAEEPADEPADEPLEDEVEAGEIGALDQDVTVEQEPEAGVVVADAPVVDPAGTHDGPEPTRPLPPPVRPVVASPTPSPLRESRPAVRAHVEGATARRLDLDEDPEATAVRLPEHVEPHRGSDPELEQLALDEPDQFVVEPAPDPVIGPQLAGARTRLGLTVDQLSERTRIRPHVIEALEVDDFAPCGGDFYARGHLRTLARILGVDAEPLLATYTERYADAPIDPRRVFAAELASARGGALRPTRGPSWSVLVAAVMAVVLVWSIARLVMDDGPSVQPQVRGINSSGGVNNDFASAAEPLPVVITAAGGGARVVARDGAGEIVFDGQLAFNQSQSFQAAPPVRISTTDGSLEVTLDGEERGAVGSTGQQAQQTYVVR